METGDRRWYVLHVRPRCEKKVAEYCGTYAVEHYLPLRTETRVYQRRKVTFSKPVFTGYVFVHAHQPEKAQVLRSNNIARVIEVVDQGRFESELTQVRRALEVDPTLGACDAVKQGSRVRITVGPFMGLEGIVHTLKGKTRVMLNVDMIGQAVPVEVDVEMLEPAE